MECTETCCGTCPNRILSWLADISEDEGKELDKLKTIISVKRGDKLDFRYNGKEGFYCLGCCIILLSAGRAGRKKVVSIYGYGDILVNYNCDNIPTYEYTTKVISPHAHVCFFPKQQFQELCLKYPKLLLRMAVRLKQQMIKAESRISTLSDYYLKSRVAATLVYLSDRFGKDSANGRIIVADIDRGSLAELSGTIVESLARTLTEFEKSNLIRRDKRKIVIVDREGLLKV